MALQVPDALRSKLVALRAKQLSLYGHDEFLVGREVVVLTHGFGPAVYLGLDGRVVIWHYMEDEPPRMTDDIKDIATGLVIGAKRLDLPELLELLPICPSGGIVCRQCSGRRWAQLGKEPDEEATVSFVCWECGGLGWQAG